MLRKTLCTGLGGLLLLAAKPALALVLVNLTIDYFPNTIQPDPTFQGTQLAGTATFFSEIINGNGPQPIVRGPFDIGHLSLGGEFSTAYIPADPCFADGSCRLDFSFGGSAGQFAADGFAAVGDLPSATPDRPPILPVGTLLPTDSCGDASLPVDPCRASGRIVAFDAPVVVGSWEVTWEVTTAALPEPGTAVLFTTALGLLLALRRRRATG